MEDNQKKNDFVEYDASLEPDTVSTIPSDDEIQDSVLEDSGMNKFQLTIARMDEKKWTLVQRIVGAILGVASGLSLFWNGGSDDQQGFSWSLILAVVFAMLVPNIIEKQGLRRVAKLRVALVIALGVMVFGYFLYFMFFLKAA